MARQNQWQSFAQNFTGVYDAINKGARGIEMGIASNADYNDPNGIALKGEALGLAKNQRMADIEAKYGDPTAGQTLLNTAADARAKTFTNNLNTEIRPDLVYQKGAGATKELNSRINQANAAAANSSSQAEHRNAMSPLRVAEQGLINDQKKEDLNRYKLMTPYEVHAAGLKNAKTMAETETITLANELGAGTLASDIEAKISDNNVKVQTERGKIAGENALNEGRILETRDKRLKLEEAKKLSDSLVRAGITGNDLKVAQNIQASLQIEVDKYDKDVAAEIWANATGKDAGKYENQEQVTAAMLKQIAESDMSPENKAKYSKLIQENDLMQVGARAAEITQGMIEAQQQGGIDGMVDFYAQVHDNHDGDIRRLEDGTVQAIVIGPDGKERVVASASGPDAEDQVQRSLMQQFTNPLGAMGLAVAENELNQGQANVVKTVAETSNIEQGTLLKAAQVDKIASDIGVDSARIKQIEGAIKLDDARSSLIVLQGAGQALQNENFEADFALEKANIESQINLRGVQGSLSEANQALVAANVLRVKEEIRKSKQDRYIRDPNREFTAQEQSRFIAEQWTEVFKQAQALNPYISGEEARTLRETFEYSLVDVENTTHTPVTPSN